MQYETNEEKLITQSDDLIAQGVAKKLIRIGDDGKRIEYFRHGISRDWTKPDGRGCDFFL